MKGLKTQEGSRFERFWSIVQRAAQQQGKVFFLDCGEGRDFETADMEGEDLFGWLIPQADADAFEAEWKSGHIGDRWTDFTSWVIWSDDGGITVDFKTY